MKSREKIIYRDRDIDRQRHKQMATHTDTEVNKEQRERSGDIGRKTVQETDIYRQTDRNGESNETIGISFPKVMTSLRALLFHTTTRAKNSCLN